jgi:hypothetical protein
MDLVRFTNLTTGEVFECDRSDLETLAEGFDPTNASGLCTLAGDRKRRNASLNPAVFHQLKTAHADFLASSVEKQARSSGSEFEAWLDGTQVTPETDPVAPEPDKMRVAYVPTGDRVLIVAYPDATGIHLGDYLALVDGEYPATIIDPDDDVTVLGTVDPIREAYRVMRIEGSMIVAKPTSTRGEPLKAQRGERVIRVTVVEAQNGHSFRGAPR